MLRSARTLTHHEARRVYNRIGRRQDTQAFYEDPAVQSLIEHAALASAYCVYEFGCGTGRLAERLLREHLPPQATYRGVDLSPVMVGLARDRLKVFGPRVAVELTEGGPPEGPAASCDRFISTYVLDLLAEVEIRATIASAHRMLEPGGHLCLVSLTGGVRPLAKTLMTIWGAIHALHPALVGGCRPIELRHYLGEADWTIHHRAKIEPYGVPSEVIVAEPRSPRAVPG